MAKITQIIFLSFFFQTIIYPQSININFEHLSIDDGLSQSTVNCILQDHRGFMWFGTEEGLNKYDGYTFTIYRHEPNDSTSLSHNSITVIYEDNLGTLWIGTPKGLNRFDREKEKFNHYFHNLEDPKSISNNFITSVIEDKFGVLWVGTLGGLNKFDRENEEFTHYKHNKNDPNSLSNNNINSICQDQNGDLWVGASYGGLNRFDRENEQFTRYLHDKDDSTSLSADNIWTVYVDRRGILWIGTDGGLNRYNSESKRFFYYKHNPTNPVSLSHDLVSFIYEDKLGVMWIGTVGGGLNIFDRETEKFERYTYNSANPKSLSQNFLLSIYEDCSGIIWIGTYGGGINKYDYRKGEFYHYNHNAQDPKSLSNKFVNSIIQDYSGTLWIGTEGGLNKFDEKRNRFIHYLHKKNDSKSLSNNVIYSIYEDRRGVLWIGILWGGLNRFDREEERFIHYMYNSDDSTSLSNNNVYSIYEDHLGVLWIGTERGLNRFDREKEKFIHYMHNANEPTSLSSNVIYQIYEDQLSELWIGTYGGGLNRLDREEEQFIHYMYNSDDSTSLSNNNVYSIYEDHLGVLWIGTEEGLNRFDREKEKFLQFRLKDGLPNETICGILEDKNQNLWISTQKGLSKFNPNTGKFKNFDERDGLQSNEFTPGACYKSNNGTMFFGGINGLNSFHPEKITNNSHKPPIILTNFYIFNRLVKPEKGSPLTKSISEINNITLSYSQSVFSFEFAALDFVNPKRNHYSYKMEGVDPDWVYTDASRRFATYTQLKPGKYIFTVKGSNNDGLWNEEGTSLSIIIHPPWWKTNWAYIIYILILGTIIYGIWQFQLGRVKMKHRLEIEQKHAEKLEEFDRLKSHFFANISHEFRTPLTLIIGPLEQMISGKFKGNLIKQFKLMNRSAKRLLKLINQLLDLSKLDSGRMTLHARETEMIPYLKVLVQAFKLFAELKNISLQFKANQDSIKAYIDHDKFENIMNNLLSNALKFTPKGGRIIVSIGIKWNNKDFNLKNFNSKKLNTEKFIEISITNTGPGISNAYIDKIFDRFFTVEDSETREHRGIGIGLALTKELVQLHGGSIRVKSTLDEQTTFSIILPVGKDHLKPKDILFDGSEGISHKPFTDVLNEEIYHPIISTFNHDEVSPISLVLIVEDNSDLRKYLKNILHKTYRIIDAKDGNEGYNKAIREIPDLIISDVMMSGMDGFEFCKKIKTDERTSHIPLILLTALATRDDKITGLHLGADDYITKPFDSEELIIRVHNIIDQRKNLREQFSKNSIFQFNDLNITPYDEKLMKKIVNIIKEHIDDPELTTQILGAEVGLSRSQLFRKVRALTNFTPHSFMRFLRLTHAVSLLDNRNSNITEVAYNIGFKSPSHFTQAFKKQFGLTPSNYLKKYNSD